MPEKIYGDSDLLSEICKITEMGRYGISQVLPISENGAFSNALRVQDAEYEKIYETAEKYLAASNLKPESIGAGAKMGTFFSSKLNTANDSSASHIAEMMIIGSTSGIAKTMRSVRSASNISDSTHELVEKLLKTEEANIEQMKKYL